MKTLKTFRYISVSLISASLLLFALACGGDDDDDDDGKKSEETGGTKAETGGSDDTGGTSETTTGGKTATGGTSGGDMDAGQIDGGKPLPEDVAEGGECTMVSMLFTATGKCSSSKDCPGGLPTQFDISGIGINPSIAEVLQPPENDQANCASGLTCCVNTDQCDAIFEALKGNTMVQGVLGDTMSDLSLQCVDTGSCEATSEGNDFGELPTGCEEGKGCCVNVPPIELPDAGAMIPVDASAATTDASAES